MYGINLRVQNYAQNSPYFQNKWIVSQKCAVGKGLQVQQGDNQQIMVHSFRSIPLISEKLNHICCQMPGSSLILIHSFISQDDPSLDVHCVRDKKISYWCCIVQWSYKRYTHQHWMWLHRTNNIIFCRNVLCPIWGFFSPADIPSLTVTALIKFLLKLQSRHKLN